MVHTAIVKLLEQPFLRSALPADMACRAGHGTHRAVLAARRFLGQHRFAMHLDVRAFFPSIEPAMALGLVQRRVHDRAFIDVLERVLDSGTGLVDRPGVREWLGLADSWPPPGIGLPVGAHTSQFLATHVVLQGLDHFVKRTLKVPGYVRFVDDLLLFGDRRGDLRSWRAAIGEWLWTERRLLLKHPHAPILSAHGHVDALGMRITRGGAIPLPRSERRFRARLALAARDQGFRRGDVRGSIAASVHHLLG